MRVPLAEFSAFKVRNGKIATGIVVAIFTSETLGVLRVAANVDVILVVQFVRFEIAGTRISVASWTHAHVPPSSVPPSETNSVWPLPNPRTVDRSSRRGL